MSRLSARHQRDADFTAYLAARQPALLRTAYLLTGDEHSAEDVVQSALARLYLAWDRVQHAESPDAYVRRAIINEATSWWRRAWRRREVASDVLPDVAVTPELGGPDGTQVWRLVRDLPPRQRAVIVLRYYEQLSETEIADILGISRGTVKSQASRALAALRMHAPELEEQR
ncbi:MAG TPA: SigE family RNA polymerase sigma factor [Gemmatimonadaceae bacterium]|nr:SigE family RNA polymerase sigma factor [Gemmatimonadaceae bacterium]